MIRRGERKRTVDEVSKRLRLMSKPGVDASLRDKHGSRPESCPGGIRHLGGAKLGSGSCMERENLSLTMQRETSKRQNP